MKLWDILKVVGSGVISTAVPGGPMIVGAINALLPEGGKLPNAATGVQAVTAISTLPPDQQAAVLSKQYEVTIEEIRQSHSTVRAMLASDVRNPHSTRPYIAKGAFHVVAFAIVAIVAVWAYGVLGSDEEMVRTVVQGWPFVLAAIGPLIVLLHAYFGVLRTEHKNKLDAANGSTAPQGLAGILAALFKK